MIDREHKIVKLSILVLCFSLVFVYMIWFYVKGDQLKIIKTEEQPQQNIPKETTRSTDSQVVNTPTVERNNDNGENKEEKGDVVNNTPVRENNETPTPETPSIQITEQDTTFTPSTVEERKVLSGTWIVDDGIEVAEVLGIEYKYALKDDKGIVYLYLGDDMNNDFVAIAGQYEGKVYAIDTEYEIKKNALFGERVVYLNLPGYYKKKVLMIVKYDSQYWLLSIDYPIYHKSKKYLKDLFNGLH